MNSATEVGPFRVQETAGVTRTYWVAIDPHSGICATGRESRGEADADRKALNAAYRLGQVESFWPQHRQHRRDDRRDIANLRSAAGGIP